MATIISADDIKKEFVGYTPEKAGEFHVPSAKLADKRFDECLKTTMHDTVILMSGGPASGKTEFVSEYLLDQDVLIFDGILPTKQGAKIKIDHIKQAGKAVKIYAVWPHDFKQAYVAFLHRDRKFHDEHFFTKHAGARATLLFIATAYLDVPVRLFKSAYVDDLQFTEVQFSTRNELIDFLVEHQYATGDILKSVLE